jgi:AcrR family transcriptional regulator
MADKEKQILQASIGLFARFGLRKTTVEEIARAANVGKGTVYLYFKSKEEMFARVMQEEIDLILDKIHASVKQHKTVRDRLHSLIKTRFEFMDERMKELQVTESAHAELHFLSKSEPLVRAVADKYHQQEREILVSLFKEGIKTGEIQVEDSELVAMAISAALETVDHAWDVGGADLTLEKKTEVLVQLFMDGLRTRTETPSGN